MKNYLLLFSVLVIAVLLWLLWDGSNSRAIERKQYLDSLATYARQEHAMVQKIIVEEQRVHDLEEKSRASTIQYQTENSRLKSELRKARTPRVEQVIEEEPEVAHYLDAYDSVLWHTELRLDSVQIQCSVITTGLHNIVAKKDSLIAIKDSRIAYVERSNEDLSKENAQLEKKVKRRTGLAAILILLNLVPR